MVIQITFILPKPPRLLYFIKYAWIDSCFVRVRGWISFTSSTLYERLYSDGSRNQEGGGECTSQIVRNLRFEIFHNTRHLFVFLHLLMFCFVLICYGCCWWWGLVEGRGALSPPLDSPLLCIVGKLINHIMASASLWWLNVYVQSIWTSLIETSRLIPYIFSRISHLEEYIQFQNMNSPYSLRACRAVRFVSFCTN